MIDVERQPLKPVDQLRAVVAELDLKAVRKLVLKGPQPREQNLALRRGEVNVAEAANGVAHALERTGSLRADGAVRHPDRTESFPLPLHARMVTAMPQQFDRAAIERVIKAVADELDGDWLLVGGALVALWLEPRRVTEDIDIVGNTADSRLRLMQLIDRLGLPVEAVNSAADFFVHRIAGWQREVELFRQGARGRILRPNATLFLLLKLRRLSERDLDDCLALLATKPRFDTGRVHAELDALERTDDEELRKRRETLRNAF